MVISISDKRKEFLQTFLVGMLYGVFFYVLQVVLKQRDIIGAWPDEDVLSIFDAGWYKEIVEQGYIFKKGPANTAFYPLFPWIWKLSHLGAWGISFLNILFFATGISIMATIYKISIVDKFIWISTPSMFYAFIPYTEALFILLISLVFLAMHKKNNVLLWISLFLVSLVRPVSMILLPAFLVIELLSNDRALWYKSLVKFIMNYGLPLMAGIIFFVWYQYYETGVWFAFFKQEKNWGHEFAWPTLPFNNMYGPKALWLDALAMFVGFVSVLFLVLWGISWLFKNRLQHDKILVLSFLYLAAIMLIAMLFNPIWGTYTTNVYSTSRYAFASPFFLVFLYHFTVYNPKYRAKHFILVFLLTQAFWLLFGSYYHIMAFVYYSFNTVLVMLYMLYADKQKTWPALIILPLNIIMQVFLFYFHTHGSLVG